MAYEVVVVGTSLGGLRALGILLSGLPPDFPLPVVIVQHRHNDSDDSLRTMLQPYSILPVHEAEDKECLIPGHVFLAPANYHVLIEPGHLALSIDPPVLHARPSIDVLFESAAEVYAKGVIGVLLTGASADGALGLAKIKACGGMALVQEPATAESSVMPLAAIAATIVDGVLPVVEIAPFLVKLVSSD